jgi:hypothetical protein
MSSIYGRLGFNSSDPTTANTVTNYTANVVNGMNLLPTLLNAWQTQDIASSNTGGYFVNPVANVTQTIKVTSNTIVGLISGNLIGSTPTITTNLQNTKTYANTVFSTTANSYLYITNRESNVVDVGTDVTTPHYKFAMGIGKMLSYITYQSDNVQNNSPIMGSFTSITLGNTLNSLSSTLANVTIILTNSITGGIPPTSNISLADSQLLLNTMYQIANTMYSYPLQDTQFFTNSRSVIDDYHNVSQFSHIGATETYLLNNYIGTDKIKSRINSGTITK